jgi:hypothetical protein
MTRVGQRMGSGGARRDGSPLSATGWFRRPAPAGRSTDGTGTRQQTVYPPPRQTPTRERRIRSERPPSPSGTIRATPPPIRPAKNRRGEAFVRQRVRQKRAGPASVNAEAGSSQGRQPGTAQSRPASVEGDRKPQERRPAFPEPWTSAHSVCRRDERGGRAGRDGSVRSASTGRLLRCGEAVAGDGRRGAGKVTVA